MNRYIPFWPLAILLFISSCSPRLYFPDRANVPVFTEAGELKVVASGKLQNNDANGNLAIAPAADGAYAPINHLGIIGSWRSLQNRDGYLYPTRDKVSSYSINNKQALLTGSRLELGAGYFTTFGNRGVFEVYGGYGNGSLTGDGAFSARYNRFFVQSQLSFKNKIVSLSGGLRLAMQKYYNFNSPDSMLRYQIDFKLPDETPVDFTSQNFLFAEPFVNLEVGYKYVFFNVQMGISGQIDGNSSIIGDSNMFVSLGIVMHADLLHHVRLGLRDK